MNKPTESANIEPPCYATFHGKGGYDGERMKALETFKVGERYKIIGGSMGQSYTRLEIEGHPGGWNSVLFDYDHKSAPVKCLYTKRTNAPHDLHPAI